MKFSIILKIVFTVLFFAGSVKTTAQENQELINYSSSNGNAPGSTLTQVIVDSDISHKDALSGKHIPDIIKNDLELVTVFYYGFDDKLHQGQILVNKDVVQDITEIFQFIRETKFPIEKVVPICDYKWSDEESMKDNNTCSFNYRFISGTRIHSMHASGLAIDINPFLNPYIKNHIILPEGASYDTTKRGTLNADSPLVREFKKRGWTWGGDWKSLKDYQHFEKQIDKDSTTGK
jgi:hypothetical protein